MLNSQSYTLSKYEGDVKKYASKIYSKRRELWRRTSDHKLEKGKRENKEKDI